MIEEANKVVYLDAILALCKVFLVYTLSFSFNFFLYCIVLIESYSEEEIERDKVNIICRFLLIFFL